jgi:predicted ATPase/DNA-binding SARP family transcriptional activator
VEVIGAGAVRRGAAAVSGLELGGRRARVALAALALTDGPVPADRLAALIWSNTPPPTWPAALRGVIRSLRTALDAVEAGGQRLIATTPSGYCLAAGASVDLDLAEAALAEASALAGHGRHEAAIAAAEPVTGISGDQLLPGEDGPWLAPYRALADALALRALELVADSASALGNHHRAVAEGRRAVTASPLNERSHRILFRALHGAGDRAGVVQAYEACREILAEQLGVDPALETVDAYLAAIGSAAPGGPSAGTAPGGGGPGRPARVPQPTSAFFGRAEEAAALAAAIAEPGLVTVAGRGGVGKTRLVTQVARTAATAAALSGGRLWVSLAAVDADALVAAEAAMVLGLPVAAVDATTLIADYLAPLGRALLVLDGCEAVLDGTASLAASLLAACPALTLVVTSRVPLSVETERVVGVAVFPPPVYGNWRELAASDPVRLLVDRARRGGGELAVDEAITPFVAELCRRCGGLPLAIELAGAQLAAMSVPDLLDHLPELAVESADRVRAIAESSYALLHPDEATVFRRLAVLDGPVALPFLREVVAGGAIAPLRLVRILRELTARGLLSVDRSGPRWRYHQDDDLHRLARELLDAAEAAPGTSEAAEVTARLADAVSAVVPADAKAPPGPYLDEISEVIAAVRSLLGAAADGAFDLGRALDIAFRLHRYWAATNVAEGRFWLSRLLAGAPGGPGTAHASYALGYLGYWAGDTVAAAADLRSAADQLHGQPDEYAARALIYLGGLADDMDQGEEALGYVRRAIAAAAPFGADLQVGAAIGMGCVLAERASPQAAGFAAEAIALCRRSGSPEQLAATLPTAAMVCWQVGDLDAARGYVAEAMPLLVGSRRIARVVLLSAAAGIALADGDLEAAVELGASADADARDLGIDREVPLIRCVLARALLAAGDAAGAAARAAEAITAARSLSYPFPMALCLETAAVVLLHPAMVASRPGAVGPAGRAGAAGAAGTIDEALADAGVVQASGRLLAAAAAIRARGDRPGPVPLSAATARARLACPPPETGDGGPEDAAELAVALLARRAGTQQPGRPLGKCRPPTRSAVEAPYSRALGCPLWCALLRIGGLIGSAAICWVRGGAGGPHRAVPVRVRGGRGVGGDGGAGRDRRRLFWLADHAGAGGRDRGRAVGGRAARCVAGRRRVRQPGHLRRRRQQRHRRHPALERHRLAGGDAAPGVHQHPARPGGRRGRGQLGLERLGAGGARLRPGFLHRRAAPDRHQMGRPGPARRRDPGGGRPVGDAAVGVRPAVLVPRARLLRPLERQNLDARVVPVQRHGGRRPVRRRRVGRRRGRRHRPPWHRALERAPVAGDQAAQPRPPRQRPAVGQRQRHRGRRDAQRLGRHLDRERHQRAAAGHDHPALERQGLVPGRVPVRGERVLAGRVGRPRRDLAGHHERRRR